MAKKTVVQIVCDRCDRTEYVDPENAQAKPDLEVYFGPREPAEGDQSTLEICVTFNDLCSSCTKTVRNLIEQATKKISWKRGGPAETEIGIEETEG